MQHKSSRRKLSRLGAVGALAAALVLSACGPVAGGSDAEESRLTLAVQSPPRSLDPIDLDAGTQAYVWSSLYDTILYRDAAGEIQPNAAEAWEYSDDGLTLTLTIREGMTFSSGDPVDAAAVKATLDRNKERTGQQQEKMQRVVSVEAPDPSTVVITFSAHDAAFLFNLTQDGGAIADPATVDDERTTTNPVGSGPYTLDTEKTVNGSTYVLERRDDYWNVDEYPYETLSVRVLADQTAALNALRSGQVDVATVPANQVETVTAAGGIDTTFVETVSIAFINLADRAGTTLEPLADVRVRQAINLALDREQMVEQLLFGAGTPTEQIFNKSGIAYDEALEGTYGYDPERARELMAEAGYADGFELSMPSSPTSLNFEPTITQALGEIGIRLTWQAVPAGSANAAVIAGEYPAFFAISSATAAEREVPRQLESAAQNPFGWSSPELDELIAAANAELDPAAQPEKYEAINRFVTENALFAPVFFVGSTIAHRDSVAYTGDGTNTFSTVRLYAPAD